MIFKKDLHRQINEFIEYKRDQKGEIAACTHKEWLVKFAYIVNKKHVHDLEMADVFWFKEKIMDHYFSDYAREEAIHSVRCFLKFYRRYDILNEMAKVGRKPNLKKIEYVKHFREKGLTFRDIQQLLLRGGRRIPLKTLHFWAHYK